MHDHHHHFGDHSHVDGFGEGGRIGHNRPKAALQWQVAHLPEVAQREAPTPDEPDLDLVETAFVEGFEQCSDPTSFLRMAHIPFVGVDGSNRRLHLLRVETEYAADVGAVAPLIGGGAVRYDPLPAGLVSRRRKLAFVFHDGSRVQRLDLAAVRSLHNESGSSRVPLASDA